MLVFYNGKKYNFTAREIIELVKNGRFSPDTEVEYKGTIHRLREFKEIKKYFKNVDESQVEPEHDDGGATVNETSKVAPRDEITPPPPTENDGARDVDVFLNVEKAKRKKIVVVVASCLGVVALLTGILALILTTGDKSSRRPNLTAKSDVANGTNDANKKSKPKISKKASLFELKDSDDFAEIVKTRDVKELSAAAHDFMLLGSITLDSCCDLTYDTWNDAIDKSLDFNLALRLLNFDEDFREKISESKKNQERVAAIMKALKDKPRKDQKLYELLLEQYQVFIKYTRLATDPSGSLLEYGRNCVQTRSEFSDNEQMLKLYLE